MRTFQRLRTGLLVVGLMLSATLPGWAASPDIRGIYVNGQKFYLSNGQLAQAIAMPGVDGILVNLDWTDIASATTAKTYSWTLLDNMVQLAVAQGKKFEIDIITGGSTPSWVFDPAPQGLGAASGNFVYVQSNKPGATCLDEKLPLPWNDAYIAAYSDLLQQLSAHLTAQGTYSSFTMLRLTGINTLTDELRLPGQTPISTPQFSCMIDNLKAWIDVGYSQGQVVTGWRQMLTATRRAFPDKFFNLALITEDGFPAFCQTVRRSISRRRRCNGIRMRWSRSWSRSRQRACQGNWSCNRTGWSMFSSSTQSRFTCRRPMGRCWPGRRTNGNCKKAAPLAAAPGKSRSNARPAPTFWRC